MPAKMILTGDVNLMNVANPGEPFAQVGAHLRDADVVFSNLECCLYDPPAGHTVEQEGFFADPEIAGAALREGGVAAVGLANNVNYGSAAILGSIDRLDRIGVAHTGAGGEFGGGAGAGDRRDARRGTGSGFCSAARSIGRPTTRRARRGRGSRRCGRTPPIRCRRTRPGPRSRR